MLKKRANQINTRVDDETAEALRRLAAATGNSLGVLTCEVLTQYVDKEQNAGGHNAFDAISQQFDERLAEHDRRLVREIETIIKPIKKELIVVKAQLDVMAEFVAPGRRVDYQKAVERLMQAMGVQTNGGRP
jgi:predicted transcriptional regulator